MKMFSIGAGPIITRFEACNHIHCMSRWTLEIFNYFCLAEVGDVLVLCWWMYLCCHCLADSREALSWWLIQRCHGHVLQTTGRFRHVDGCNDVIAWGCWVVAGVVMDATLTSSCRLLRSAMVINITAPIVMETAMGFCNGGGRSAAIFLHTLVGFAVILDEHCPSLPGCCYTVTRPTRWM